MTKIPLQISPKRSHQTHVSHDYKLQRTSITRMRQLVNNHRFANNYCELKIQRVRKQHSTPCTCDSKSSTTNTSLVSSDDVVESNSTCDCPTTANHMQTDPWNGLLPLKPVELTLEEIIECCAKSPSEDFIRKNCVYSHRRSSLSDK